MQIITGASILRSASASSGVKIQFNLARFDTQTSTNLNNSIEYFPFHDIPLLQEWLAAMQQPGWTPAEDSSLCSDHFTVDCFHQLPTGISLLKSNAVPTIFQTTTTPHWPPSTYQTEPSEFPVELLRCCAPGCCNNSSNVDKSLFPFPFYKPVVLKQWLANMQCSEWFPTSCSRLCSDHFEQNAFDWLGPTLQLRDDAVPSIFLSSSLNHVEKLHLADPEEPSTTYLCNVNGNNISSSFADNANASGLLDKLYIPYDSNDMQLVALENAEELDVHFNISSNTRQELTAVPRVDEETDIKPNPSIMDVGCGLPSDRITRAKMTSFRRIKAPSSSCVVNLDSCGKQIKTNKRFKREKRKLFKAESSSPTRDLREVLLKFQKEDYLCDAVLVADDGHVRAHSVVLAAASATFKESLKSNQKPEERVIVLPGLELYLLKVIIHFAYTGNIMVPKKYGSTDARKRVVDVLVELGFNAALFQMSSTNDSKSTENCSIVDEDSEATDIENNEEFELDGVDLKGDSTPTAQNTDIELNTTLEENTDIELNTSIELNIDKERRKVRNGRDAKYARKKCSEVTEIKRNRRVNKMHEQDINAKQMFIDQLSSVSSAVSQRLCDKCGKLVGGKHKCLREGRKDPVQCPECGIQCSTRPNLRRHMMQHTGERPHLCQHCGEGFIQRQSLQDHVTSYHPETVPNDPCIVARQCPDCGETFYKSGQLQKHLRSQCGTKMRSIMTDGGPRTPREHDPSRPYACLKCERRFKLKASLIIHEHVHSKKKTLVRASLTRIGAGPRRRECNVCGKRTISAEHWRAHMAGHIGEPSLVCKTCGKSFQHRMLLISHERVHTGEKPFACSICQKKFAHDSELRNHVRVHTDEKPYECTICGKRLRQNAHLQSHMRTHTGEKPFGCQLCDKSYKNLVDLRFHYRRMHQVELPKRQNRRSVSDVEEIKDSQSV